MKVDYLIIGQGIAGTMLSYEMQKAGLSFAVLDDASQSSASSVASGIINPVTGRRIVETWMISELLSSAFTVYRELENLLAIKCFRETSILDFFPTAQMRLAFTDRVAEVSAYLALPQDEYDWLPHLNYDLGYGIIRPAYLVDMEVLLSRWRQRLLQQGLLMEERFAEEEMSFVDGKISYHDVSASFVIYCDGVAGGESKYFRRLPFAPNKGEALIVDISGLPSDKILKKGLSIVPWKQGLFWVGSSHEWNYDSPGVTEIFREKTLAQLRAFCKMPVTLVEHLSGIRPATLERRPFVGFHPGQPRVGIFNGLGTKGCSLAPHFAAEFVKVIKGEKPMLPEVDVKRFTKILQR